MDRLDTGTHRGTGTPRTELVDATAQEDQELSALGEAFEATPMVIPIRAHLDNFKVAEYGRDSAVAGFRDTLLLDRSPYASLWTLSGTRLVCHCRANERCHGDVLVEEFRKSHPTAYDRSDCHGAPPEPGGLSFMARLREEPDSDDGSSPDEGVPNMFAGHRGIGEPMQVGVGYTQRDLCDGQTLASPDLWPPGSRLYPTSAHWNRISNVYRRFTDHHGTEELLVSLAMGKVDKCPFPLADIAGLKKELIDVAAEYGFHLERRSGDRTDVPIDFRFLHMLHMMAGDPEVGLGEYSQGVRVGPGTRMLRLPALYGPKRKWPLASPHDPLDYLEQTAEPEGIWRRNYWTLETFEDEVLEVMHDQASRSQLLVLTEAEAKSRFPDLVIAEERSERRGLVGRSQHACCSTGHTVRQHQNKDQRPGTGADCP